MATFPNSAIPLTGYVGLTDPADTYATHVDILGWGGKMSVATITERNAIPLARRKFGMMVTVNADPTPANNKTYRLDNIALGGSTDTLTDNDNWSEFNSGSGGVYVFSNGITETAGTVKLGGALDEVATVIQGADGQSFAIRNAADTEGFIANFVAGSASTMVIKAETGNITVGSSISITSGLAQIDMPSGQILLKYNSGVLLNAVSTKIEITKDFKLSTAVAPFSTAEEGYIMANSLEKDFRGYINGAWANFTRPGIVTTASTSITPTEADRNSVYYLTADTAITVTLNNLSVGHAISFVLVGDGPVTFAAGSGMTFAGLNDTLSMQNTQATLIQKSATEWTGFGALGDLSEGYTTIQNYGTALPLRNTLNILGGLTGEDVGGKTQIRLGGSFDAAVTLLTNGFDFIAHTAAAGRRSRYAVTTTMADFQHYASTGDSSIISFSDAADVVSTSWLIGVGADTKRIQMIANVSGITITDSVSDLGMLYAADYGLNFSTRSITDKNYQDTHLGGKLFPVPGAPQDGQSIRWNNGGNTWEYFTAGSGSGSGTVSSFSAGNLSPLFTTSVATATTTPALSFTLTTQAANRVFAGPLSGSAAAPTFRSLIPTDIQYITRSQGGATYELTEADNGYVISFTNAAGCVVTIPTGLSAGWKAHLFRSAGMTGGDLVITSDGTLYSAGTTLDTAKTIATVWHDSGNIHYAIGAFLSATGGTTYTFSNGLTETGGSVVLGGALTANTTITGAATYDLTLGTFASRIQDFNISATTVGIDTTDFYVWGDVNRLEGETITLAASTNVYLQPQGSIYLTANNVYIQDIASATSANILYYNSATGNVTYGAAPTAYTFGNGLTNTAGTVTLGDATITDDITFGNFSETYAFTVGWSGRASTVGFSSLYISLESDGAGDGSGQTSIAHWYDADASTNHYVSHVLNSDYEGIQKFRYNTPNTGYTTARGAIMLARSVTGSGGVANGVGYDITYQIKNSSVNGYAPDASIQYTLTDVTAGGEDSKYTFQTNAAGSTVTAMELSRGGLLVPALANTTTVDVLYYNSATGAITYGTAPGGTSYTFSNGITNTAGAVKLGGALTGNTTITGADTYSLTLGSGSSGKLGNFNVGVEGDVNDDKGVISFFNGTVQVGGDYAFNQWYAQNQDAGFGRYSNTTFTTEVGSDDDLGLDGYSRAQIMLDAGAPWEEGDIYPVTSAHITLEVKNTDNEIITFQLSTTNNQIKVEGDDAGFKGIVYNADYSSGYTSRSLVDKGYADSKFLGLALAAPTGSEVNKSIRWNSGGTAWEYYTPSVGGGGITNGAAANEMMKSDGTNATTSGIFSTSDGNILLGAAAGSGGNRSITAQGSATDIALDLYSKGDGLITIRKGSTYKFIATAAVGLYGDNFYFYGSNSGGNGMHYDQGNKILQFIDPVLADFAISGMNTAIAGGNGGGLLVRGGNADNVSGNGNGGTLTLKSGLRRTAGVGTDGNVEIDSLAGFIKLTQTPANDDALTQVLVRDGSTGYIKYRSASSLSGGGSTAGAITFVLYNGGDDLTTGLKDTPILIPTGFAATAWHIMAYDIDNVLMSTSAVVDIVSDEFANLPLAGGDTITGSDKPTLSSTSTGSDTSITWTAIVGGEYVQAEIESISAGVKKLVVVIKGTKS
jgi:hypothetical protein